MGKTPSEVPLSKPDRPSPPQAHPDGRSPFDLLLNLLDEKRFSSVEAGGRQGWSGAQAAGFGSPVQLHGAPAQQRADSLRAHVQDGVRVAHFFQIPAGETPGSEGEAAFSWSKGWQPAASRPKLTQAVFTLATNQSYDGASLEALTTWFRTSDGRKPLPPSCDRTLGTRQPACIYVHLQHLVLMSLCLTRFC